MHLKSAKVLNLALFFSISLSVNAENAAPLLRFPEDTLKAIDIFGYRERVRTWLPESGQLTLFSGKKTELIRLDDIGANTVQNQARSIFAKAPGLSVWESDGSGIQINVASRGLSPNRSWEFNVRQNGFEIAADPLGYPEAYYNPPAEAVGEIRIIRGASGLQFGPQFGGLLDYRIRKAPADRKLGVESRQSFGSYGLWSSFNAVGGTTGRISYYAFHHHRQAKGWRDNSTYRNDVSYAAIDIRLSTQWKTGFTFTRNTNLLQQPGGLTDAAFAVAPSTGPRARNWFSTPWNIITGTLTFEPDSSIAVSLTINGLVAARKSVGFIAGINIPDTINSATSAYAARQVDRDTYSNIAFELRARRNYRFMGASHILAAGVRRFAGSTSRNQFGKGTTGTRADFDLADPSGLFPRSVEFTTRNLAFYAENIFHLTKQFSLTPGFRLETVSSSGEGRFTILQDGTEQQFPTVHSDRTFILAGIGTEYRIGETWTAYANGSQAYRPVLFSDLTPPTTLDSIDPELHDARGYTVEAGVRGKWSDMLVVDAGIFSMRYADRIGSLLQARSDNSTYLFRTNLGTSRHRGVECYVEFSPLHLSARHSRMDFSVWSSLALLDAVYVDFPLANPVNGKTNLAGNRVEYAPRRIHRSGVTLVAGGLSCSLQHSYTSSVFADAGNTEKPSANAQVGRVPAWSVWDASASYSWRKHYDIRMNLSNLFNARYFTRRSGGYPGPGLLPGEARTVIVGLGVKF